MPNHEQTAVVKIPLLVSREAEEILDGHSRICNWLYNYLLEHANQLREQFRETQDPEISKTLYTERGLRDLIPALKKKKPFLRAVYSSLLKNAALRVSSAIQAYQQTRKGRRKGKNTGWPRFRRWGRGWFSLLYDEPSKGYRVSGNRLTLSLGKGIDRKERAVRLILSTTQALHGKGVRNLRIVKQLGQFFAVFTVRIPLPQPKKITKVIALDPNHKNLAYGVGTDRQAIEIASPRWIKTMDRRIDELCARRDRCRRKSKKVVLNQAAGEPADKFYWKPSRRRQKFDHLIEDLRRKRRDQTKTFLFTIAQALYKQYDLVAIGDYTPDGTGETKTMRRSMNNQSLIGRFKEVLAWVSLKSGKHYLEFSEKGTTRTCHLCGYTIHGGLSPEQRNWDCPECHAHHIRDENAAQNGLKRVLRDQKIESLVPGSGLASLQKRWAWRAMPSGVVTTLRGQSSDIFAAPRNSNKDMVVLDQNVARKFTHV
jgi:putative transposase